ncbi:hypothetical protein T01_3527 [Trichinella spiralis]|uniref:Uncharacterized protein n=1 Tax=Trichinella spiralis TaxID=6334 RepID=A0A0V1BBI6_TRISP|nr:hypothetical protein T01_3527 [Trichinella spiralis]
MYYYLSAKTSDGMNSTLMRLEILSSTLCNPFQSKLPKCNAIRWQSEFHKTNMYYAMENNIITSNTIIITVTEQCNLLNIIQNRFKVPVIFYFQV